MVDFFFYLSLGIAVAAWGIGYATLQLWLWISASVILGLLWLYGWLRNHPSIASTGLALFAIGNVLGVLYGIPVLLSLLSLSAALVAWDLHYFSQRLGKQKGSASTRQLEKNHFLRLLIVCAATLLVAGLGVLIRFHLSLAPAILFAVMAAFALNRMIKHLKKMTD